MAGTHRGERSGLRTRLKEALALAVIVALAIAIVWWVDPYSTLRGAKVADSPTPSASSTPSPSPPTSSPTAPASKTAAPQPELPALAEDSPRRLVVPGLIDTGFDSAVTETDGALEAGSSDEVARLADRGTPGSPGSDTVVVLGQDRFDRQAVFNDIAEIQRGAKIELRTDAGTLTYTVRRTQRIDAEDVATSAALKRTPGRLVLIGTTYDDSGARDAEDTVVVAQLSDVSVAD